MSTRQNYNVTTRIEIDNTATLLNWAKTVQNDLFKWTRPRCDYQDDYARTSHETIDTAFNDANNDERKLILCAIYNTMDYNEVERLLLVRAKAVRQAERAELYREYDKEEAARTADLDRREAAIANRERTFKESMKPYHRRLTIERHRADQAFRQLDAVCKEKEAYRQENDKIHENTRQLIDKAARYDAIRAALT